MSTKRFPHRHLRFHGIRLSMTLEGGGHGVAQHSAIRTNDFKLLYFDRPKCKPEVEDRWKLFDLRNDPQEMNNLATDPLHTEKLKSMQARFLKTRPNYDDTDENIWQRGPGEKYAPEAYIRSQPKR